MPVVATPPITRTTHPKCACVGLCIILYRQGSVAEERLWPLRRSAAAMKRTEPSMTWKPVRVAVELNTSLQIGACAARDQRAM